MRFITFSSCLRTSGAAWRAFSRIVIFNCRSSSSMSTSYKCLHKMHLYEDPWLNPSLAYIRYRQHCHAALKSRRVKPAKSAKIAAKQWARSLDEVWFYRCHIGTAAARGELVSVSRRSTRRLQRATPHLVFHITASRVRVARPSPPLQSGCLRQA